MIANTKWKGTTPCDGVSLKSVNDALTKANVSVKMYYWDQYRIQRSSQTVTIDESAEYMALNRAYITMGDENTSFYFTEETARPTYEGRRIRSEWKGGRSAVLFVVKSDADKDAVLNALGNPPEWKWTKDLPAPQMPQRSGSTAKRGTTKKEEVKVRRVVEALKPKGPEIQAEEVVQLDGDAFYAITCDGVVTLTSTSKSVACAYGDFLHGIEQAAKLKYLDWKTPIYLISAVYQKRVEAFGKWKLIGDHVESASASLPEGLAAEMLETDIIHTLGNNWTKLLLEYATIRKAVESQSSGSLLALHTFMKDQKLYELKTANPSYYRDTPMNSASYRLSHLGLNTRAIADKAQTIRRTKTTDKDLTALIAACDRAYPLVKVMAEQYNVRIDSNAVNDYVIALDQYRASKVQAKPALAAA
jgi:hypothetical protein